MGLFEHWPYVNFHELNLDWIIQTVKQLSAKYDELLKQYENIDVTEAVDQKIDEMVQDGTIQQFFDQKKATPGAPAGTLQAIWECIRTYMRNESALAYHTTEGGNNAWNYESGPEIVTNDVGRTGYAINCSSFMHLILSGVPFSASMYNNYNGLTNVFGRAGYCFNMYGETVTADNYKKYRFCREMLPRLFDMGLAEFCADDYSNIYPGDLIFMDNTGTFKAETATHVAIVLSSVQSMYTTGGTAGMYLIAECVSADPCIVTREISAAQLVSRGVYAVAHPQYQTVPQHGLETLMEVPYFGAGGSVQENRAFTDLYTNDVVTLDFDYRPSNAGQYMNLRVNGESPLSYNAIRYVTEPLNSGEIGQRKHISIVTHLKYPNAKYNAVTELRIYNTDGSAADIENLRVFRGIGSVEAEYKPVAKAATLDALQSAIMAYLTTTPQANNTFSFKLPIRLTDTVTIGSMTYSSGYMIMADCIANISTTYSTVTVTLTGVPGQVSGRYNGTAWTWQ